MVIGKKKFKRWTIWDTNQKIGVKFTTKKGKERFTSKALRELLEDFKQDESEGYNG
tara:strand:+ start:3274 stop:3441 length:168 start_codon:yes stop_codon:yes gene_type:complete